jgi:hypothetical protein
LLSFPIKLQIGRCHVIHKGQTNWCGLIGRSQEHRLKSLDDLAGVGRQWQEIPNELRIALCLRATHQLIPSIWLSVP